MVFGTKADGDSVPFDGLLKVFSPSMELVSDRQTIRKAIERRRTIRMAFGSKLEGGSEHLDGLLKVLRPSMLHVSGEYRGCKAIER